MRDVVELLNTSEIRTQILFQILAVFLEIMSEFEHGDNKKQQKLPFLSTWWLWVECDTDCFI